MEQTYNDMLAENRRLKDSLDVMIDKNAELIFREKALKAEIQKLKAQLQDERAFTDALAAKYGTPRVFDRLRADLGRIHEAAVCRQDCKVISINR